MGRPWDDCARGMRAGGGAQQRSIVPVSRKCPRDRFDTRLGGSSTVCAFRHFLDNGATKLLEARTPEQFSKYCTDGKEG
jgi:hypothetical protein